MKQLNLYYINSGSSVPEGRTVLPTDDVSIWQRCGETGTTYTSLAQILADTATLIALMSSYNAVDYLVRSTTWTSAITTSIDAMKAIGASDYCSTTLISDNTWNTAIQNSTYFEYVDNAKVPKMTGYTTPEGKASASSENPSASPSRLAWKAFDGIDDNNNQWTTLISETSGWVQFDFPYTLTVKKYKLIPSTSNAGSRIKDYKILGSNDGFSTYSELASDTLPNTSTTITEYNKLTSNNNSYKSHRLDVLSTNGDYVGAIEVQFYGRTIGGVQTWLRSAGITNKTYTTLAEVLADSTTLSALMADHNAVDYLVTAKAWASTICADSTAMSYIGLNNYASDTLLADSTWANAIENSAYKSSVLNFSIPALTSNTSASATVGTVTAVSTGGAGSPVTDGYKAFGSAGYKEQNQDDCSTFTFNEPHFIVSMSATITSESTYSSAGNLKLQYQNTSDTWVDVWISDISGTGTKNVSESVNATVKAIRAYKVNSSGLMNIKNLNVDGREDV